MSNQNSWAIVSEGLRDFLTSENAVTATQRCTLLRFLKEGLNVAYPLTFHQKAAFDLSESISDLDSLIAKLGATLLAPISGVAAPRIRQWLGQLVCIIADYHFFLRLMSFWLYITPKVTS